MTGVRRTEVLSCRGSVPRIRHMEAISSFMPACHIMNRAGRTSLMAALVRVVHGQQVVQRAFHARGARRAALIHF